MSLPHDPENGDNHNNGYEAPAVPQPSPTAALTSVGSAASDGSGLFEGLHMASSSTEFTPVVSNRQHTSADNKDALPHLAMPLSTTGAAPEAETETAPVTDKLLGLLQQKEEETEPPQQPSNETADAVVETTNEPQTIEEDPPSSSSFFGSWWGTPSSSTQTKKTVTPPPISPEMQTGLETSAVALGGSSHHSRRSHSSRGTPKETPPAVTASPSDERMDDMVEEQPSEKEPAIVAEDVANAHNENAPVVVQDDNNNDDEDDLMQNRLEEAAAMAHAEQDDEDDKHDMYEVNTNEQALAQMIEAEFENMDDLQEGDLDLDEGPPLEVMVPDHHKTSTVSEEFQIEPPAAAEEEETSLSTAPEVDATRGAAENEQRQPAGEAATESGTTKILERKELDANHVQVLEDAFVVAEEEGDAAGIMASAAVAGGMDEIAEEPSAEVKAEQEEEQAEAAASAAEEQADDGRPAASDSAEAPTDTQPQPVTADEQRGNEHDVLAQESSAAVASPETLAPSAKPTQSENKQKSQQKPQQTKQPRTPSGTDFTPLPRVRGLGQVHPDTPVPNADVCLRLLRKFARKTRPRIFVTYGGTKPLGLYSYLFGGKEDPTYVPYRMLMELLFEGHDLTSGEPVEGEDEMLQDESEAESIVHGIMGEHGDTMERAKRAVATFCFLFSSWGHASSHLVEQKDTKTRESFSDLLAAVLNAASTLVAHGCLDQVVMIVGDGEQETMPVTNLLTQSVLAADLNPERNELAAIKFLLSAGCRTTTTTLDSGELGPQETTAMLGGSHLLQTIRMLYHIFLTTESTANKITARAALQQLVTHVFGRMAKADEEGLTLDQKTSDGFPSDHHRNAFLVLRAICKLSMRNLPDQASGMHSHIGFQSSGSNETWDAVQQGGGGGPPGVSASNNSLMGIADSSELDASALDVTNREHATLIYTSAIHPALESKILALDLIYYVLTHTHFPPGFIHRSGPQFHAAIRNYLCVSLLKNCTSTDTHVVNLSLRIFVPLVRNFRVILKNEIEAFVTNVFFVILDSKNSSADHKGIVVRTFDEICSDPSTLAEIFLNYDCDLSAVDLFHRIVNTLSRVSRTGLQHDDKSVTTSLFGGASAARMEKIRFETRELRLDAMKALRQVLASLHASIVEPMSKHDDSDGGSDHQPHPEEHTARTPQQPISASESDSSMTGVATSPTSAQNPVEVYGSKKKRRAEESEAILRFNQKPSAGIAYAAKCGHIQGDDPADVARYLLQQKEVLDKTMIGEYLGREAEYQNGFSIRVLHEYVRLMDFTGLLFDDAIRYFLSGFRLPGEAQKIDRIMEKFAERFTEQNPDLFPTADVAFILSFSIIMLNTDLHNPAIKEERRMTKEGFIRNNRGICDGQDLPHELLNSIFDRIKENPISLKEDDEAREREGQSKNAPKGGGISAAMSPASFFSSHYDEMDRARESNFRKERDHIVRTTESLLKRRRQSVHETSGSPTNKTPPSRRASSRTRGSANQRFVLTEDSGLRDEYVAPMFEAAWGPALAAFSTAMESANGTVGSLVAIATDEELEIAAENAAETIEVCLTGFRFAICTGGLCGNEVARDSYMLALSRFSQLGTGSLLEPRHVRCVQTMLSLAREDGELLGTSWQHVFRALSEVNRFHQLFHLMARNDKAAAAAAERRRRRLEEREDRKKARERRKAQIEESESVTEMDSDVASTSGASDIGSLAESDIFSEDEDFDLEENMDARKVDEANAKLVYEGVSEDVIEVIYERSSSLSAPSITTFVSQLCYVSSMEISVGYGSAKDLNHVAIRHQHALLQNSNHGGDQFHHSQPNIYNLQKLVEVAHYNMESRPRLVFADLWTTIGDHLTLTALHKNPALAMYAVDSFRQLSIQFLRRDELEVFEFQRRFLKPLETVMANSKQSSTKELLLNCVARIVQVFDAADASKTKGGLKSGWVPLIVILGVGCQDEDADIAKLSNGILLSQIKQCTKPNTNSVLLTDHFSETVDALFMSINGPHADLSIQAVEACALLAGYLGDESVETPHVRQRSSSSENVFAQTQDLELWWPILMGLSQATGDLRPDFRLKALDTLFGIINQHFFPPAETDEEKEDRVQRLQLVFRGVLTPMLEYAEVGSVDRSPRVPKDFERFLTTRVEFVTEDGKEPTGWLDTMFHVFMDICTMLCKRTLEVYNSNAMFEEMFAILNHCLVSDSGALAVLGIARLEQFVTSDLDESLVTDDVWATVCHMLRKCLSVRGLPRRASSSSMPNGSSGAEPVADDEEYNLEVREFTAEERLLTDRRFVGSNAVMVIGNMLSSERVSRAMGFRWSLFLISGLGKGIAAWEEAASLLGDNETPRVGNEAPQPPDYVETAHYGRQWMNRFLLQLASMEEVATAPDDSSNTYKNAQKLVMEETANLLLQFVEKEKTLSAFGTEQAATVHTRFFKLAKELVKGYTNMRHSHIVHMAWLGSVLLNSCIQSKNEEILVGVKKFVTLVETPVGSPDSAEAEPAEAENEGDDDSPASNSDGEEAGASEETEAPDNDDDSAEENAKPSAVLGTNPEEAEEGAESPHKALSESPSDEVTVEPPVPTTEEAASFSPTDNPAGEVTTLSPREDPQPQSPLSADI